MSVREWLHKLVKGTGTVVTEPDFPSSEELKGAIKVKDIPPDVRADIEDETVEAIRDGRLIAGTAATVMTSPMRERTTLMSQELADKYESEMLTPPPDTEDGYPVGDPKGVRPPDWEADPHPSQPLTEEALTEAKEKLVEASHLSVNEVMALVNASRAEERENNRTEGAQDNKAFLTLVNAVQNTIKSRSEPSDNFASAPEEADMIPHNDTLPQFIRPEVALRKLSPDADAGGYRASTAFIRKVMELLRDVFPEVPDKLWLLDENQDLESRSFIVTVLVRVKRDRDILIQIRPNSSRCMVRGAEDEPMLDDTELKNSHWDDFVGWVSLSKSLASGS